MANLLALQFFYLMKLFSPKSLLSLIIFTSFKGFKEYNVGLSTLISADNILSSPLTTVGVNKQIDLFSEELLK